MCVSVQKTAENAGQFVKDMFGIKEEIWPFTICTSVLGEICLPVYLVCCTGWPQSNVSKVRAYCSGSDHLIRKISSGVCRVSHWFDEYLKIIKISDYFFE